MKATILTLLLITTLSCKSQRNKIEGMDTAKNMEKVKEQALVLKQADTVMMKNGKLDISTLTQKGIATNSNTLTDDGWVSSTAYSYEENLPSGLYVYVTGNEVSGYNKTVREKDNRFEMYSEYYPSGETKQIGKLFTNEFTAGVWYWFSESGELKKYEDYDTPYKFSWEDLKLFLKDKKIKNADIHQIGRAIQDNVPLWYVSFKTKELQNSDNVWEYVLNGIDGELVKKELLDISRELD